ncbi:hypothetical protein ACFSTC_04080 [Nonomuraea ferruginea]
MRLLTRSMAVAASAVIALSAAPATAAPQLVVNGTFAAAAPHPGGTRRTPR